MFPRPSTCPPSFSPYRRLKIVTDIQQKISESNTRLLFLHEHIKLAKKRCVYMYVYTCTVLSCAYMCCIMCECYTYMHVYILYRTRHTQYVLLMSHSHSLYRFEILEQVYCTPTVLSRVVCEVERRRAFYRELKEVTNNHLNRIVKPINPYV